MAPNFSFYALSFIAFFFVSLLLLLLPFLVEQQQRLFTLILFSAPKKREWLDISLLILVLFLVLVLFFLGYYLLLDIDRNSHTPPQDPAAKTLYSFPCIRLDIVSLFFSFLSL